MGCISLFTGSPLLRYIFYRFHFHRCDYCVTTLPFVSLPLPFPVVLPALFTTITYLHLLPTCTVTFLHSFVLTLCSPQISRPGCSSCCSFYHDSVGCSLRPHPFLPFTSLFWWFRYHLFYTTTTTVTFHAYLSLLFRYHFLALPFSLEFYVTHSSRFPFTGWNFSSISSMVIPPFVSPRHCTIRYYLSLHVHLQHHYHHALPFLYHRCSFLVPSFSSDATATVIFLPPHYVCVRCSSRYCSTFIFTPVILFRYSWWYRILHVWISRAGFHSGFYVTFPTRWPFDSLTDDDLRFIHSTFVLPILQ